jgi:hypothetical protein
MSYLQTTKRGGKKKIEYPSKKFPPPPQHDLKNLKKHNFNSKKKKM